MDYTILMPTERVDNYISYLLSNGNKKYQVVSDKRSGEYSFVTAVTNSTDNSDIIELLVEGIIRDGEYLHHETDVFILDKQIPIEVLFKLAKHVEYEHLQVV